MIATSRLLLRPFVLADVAKIFAMSHEAQSCRVLEKAGFVRIADEYPRLIFRAS